MSAPRLCLVGAPDDTGNLGVSALSDATLTGILRRRPDADVTLFDNGFGRRAGSVEVDGETRTFVRRGLRLSKRVHRAESLYAMRALSWFTTRGNANLQAFAASDAVLDVSGGDSFSDLYGTRRLRTITLPKRIALDLERPLVLLPQTYGPFASVSAREKAARIVRGAVAAWARDERSHDVLAALAADAYDEDRHRCGVDLAFGLDRREPPGGWLPPLLTHWLERPRSHPVIGVNVSGLLSNDAEAEERYRLHGPYRDTIRGVLLRLLDRSDARVVLVPHVEGRGPASDRAACERLHEQVNADHAGRVAVTPRFPGPREAKWLIGQLDWFCGTRMHATIAALSSGVPAVALAYSPKPHGVFAACGLADEVLDLRTEAPGTIAAAAVTAYEGRDGAGATLARRLAEVLERAGSQLDAILAAAGIVTDPSGADEGVDATAGATGARP